MLSYPFTLYPPSAAELLLLSRPALVRVIAFRHVPRRSDSAPKTVACVNTKKERINPRSAERSCWTRTECTAI